MALSQVQCLDDHNVNWRVSESKPEFFYSEDQRRAVEALIAKGRDAFMDYIRESGVREFLSEQELERIAHSAEAYRPGHEHHQPPDTLGNLTPGSHEEAGDGEVSLEYWPDRSEASVAELDLGWPDAASYRGVTRVTVHTQPPADGSTHIKEVVRKSIAMAQKMIAVVMDAFTDVDIFRDLMDAAYRRKIAVYIILDTAAVPCFLSMCGRADMHRGHIKNMRVRCCGGVEFFARSAKKVHGKLSQKFLLVDGDRAISGSYSFTWSSSRLDRNLITVITGQAVETFDLQFRELFLTSRGVSLNKVPMVDEPIPDVVPQAAPVPVSAAVARKLINPKYALVATGNYTSPNSSADNSVKKNPNGLRIPQPRLRRVVEEPAVHPALANMEKAYLIPYLPTWPEPDPPKDVIGFINIRDDKRAHQVHLQRSERFETSQAIRFSTPLTLPAQTENPAVGKEANAAVRTENPPGNTSTDAPTPTPVNPTDKQQTHTAPKIDQADATDSGEPPEQPNTPVAQERPKPNAHTPSSTSNVTADSESTDNVKETPQETPQTVAPPVPKRRTLQLVIDPAPSEQPGVQPHVTLMKMDQSESVDDSEITEEELPPDLGLTTSKDDGGDSGSNDDDDDSLDSTKVLCDRAANEDPSSASTASEEEFYDGSQQEARDPLTNGVTTGSGRGHRHGDGVNMMARLSQSMLDLREPKSSEDSANLIRQSQQLRRKDHPSPHRHIGQLFQTSKPSGHDSRLTGAKVVIAKPGSHHRPTRSTGPVIGGHRYWQGQTLHPDSAQQRSDARSSRSPRRHSPGYKKTDQTGPQPPTNSAGLLGVSFSKLSNLRHLRARGGSSQKKTPQNNKAAR